MIFSFGRFPVRMDSSERLKSESQTQTPQTYDGSKVIVTKDTNISLNVNPNIQTYFKIQSSLTNDLLFKNGYPKGLVRLLKYNRS